MKPEGPAHLVARSWRRRMVGSPYRRGRHTAVPAAGERTREILRCCSELLCSGEPHVSPDWILPYRLGAALGRKLCEVIWSLCAGSSAGQVPAVAWPVRSSLSCCLAPVRSGPAAAWSQRNQAPVGCLAPTKLRAVRPTGLHGDCRHDQPCLHTHAPADSPVWNCPPESSAGKQGHHTIIRGRERCTSPSCRKSRPGRVRVMPGYWICAGDDVVTQHGSRLRTGSSSAIHVR